MKIGRINIIVMFLIFFIVLLVLFMFTPLANLLPFKGKTDKKSVITLYVYTNNGGNVVLNNSEITRVYLTFIGKDSVKAYLKASPEKNYKFGYWIINGTIKVTSDILLLEIRGNTSVSVSFEKIKKTFYYLKILSNSSINDIIVNESKVYLPYYFNYTKCLYAQLKANDVKTAMYKYKFLYWICNGSIISNRTIVLNMSYSNVTLKAIYHTVKLGRYMLKVLSPFNKTVWLNNTHINDKNFTYIHEEPYLISIDVNDSLKLSNKVTLYFKDLKVYIDDKLLYCIYNVPFLLEIDKNYTIKIEYVAQKPKTDIFNVPIIVNGKRVITYMRIYPRQSDFNASVEVSDDSIKIVGNGIFHLRLVSDWKEIKISVKKNYETTLRIEMVMENGPEYYTKGRVFSPNLGSSKVFTMIFHNNPFIIEVKGSIYEYSGRGPFKTSFPGVSAFNTLLIEVRDGEVELKIEIVKD